MDKVFPALYAGRTGLALLILRVVIGWAFILHGLPKIRDIDAVAGMFQIPWALAAVAAWTEVLGGTLLILGFLTPVAAFFLTIQMLVALFSVHLPAGDPFVNSGGRSFELALVYLAAMIAFLLAGPGLYSLDAWLARRAETGATTPAYGRRRGTA